MFFRLKASGPRSYLQIVESRRDGARVQQHVIATIGRADELAANGGLASLLASGARFCEQVLLLSTLDDDQRAPQLGLRRIGAPMAFGRLWDELGCRAVLETLLGRTRLRLRRRAGGVHYRPASPDGLRLRPCLREVDGRLRHPRH